MRYRQEQLGHANLTRRTILQAGSGHAEACHVLLTGRLDFPPGFSGSVSK